MTLGKAKQENWPQSDVHKSLVKLISSPEQQPPLRREPNQRLTQIRRTWCVQRAANQSEAR